MGVSDLPQRATTYNNVSHEKEAYKILHMVLLILTYAESFSADKKYTSLLRENLIHITYRLEAHF